MLSGLDKQAQQAKHHHAGSGSASGATGALGVVARRSKQLARRLNAAGRTSLHVLRTAWADPPPLSPRARRAPIAAVPLRGAPAAGAGPSAAAAAAVAGDDQDLTVALDWKARLTLAQEVIVWHTAGAVCCVAYALTAPPAFSIPYATCIGLLFGFVVQFMRSSMMEVLYKAKERFETDLGDPDSKFHTHDNLQIHVKVKAPAAAASSAPSAALHCYHGFGSNTWSWSLVQQVLADRLGALVTAHDMPGFGLTERPTDLSGYYLAFNGRLGRLVMDYELKESGAMAPSEAARAEDAAYPHAHLQASEAAAEPAAPAAAPAVKPKGGEMTFSANDLSKSWDEIQKAPAGVPEARVGSASEAAAAAAAAGLEAGSAGEALAAAAAGDARSAASAVADLATGGGAAASGAAAAAAASSSAGKAAGPARRVLVGHSLGGACAALEAISRPQDYAAIVLVAPAILVGFGAGGGKETWLEQLHDDSALSRAHGPAPAAPAGSAAAAAGGEGPESDAGIRAAAAAAGGLTPASPASPSPSKSGGYTARVPGSEVAYYVARGTPEVGKPRGEPGLIGKLFGTIMSVMQTTMISAVVAIILLLRPLVLWGLRAAVRSRDFWANTLQQAYYDKTKVTPAAVDAYRLPQLVRGWESGMVRFLLARLGAKGLGASSFGPDAGTGRAPGGGLEDAGLAQRLAAAVAEHSIPVLIVHGAGDKLVPVSNTLRLARMLPGARVAVVKRSGHCPQEEVPEGFAQITETFLKAALAAPRAQAAPA